MLDCHACLWRCLRALSPQATTPIAARSLHRTRPQIANLRFRHLGGAGSSLLWHGHRRRGFATTTDERKAEGTSLADIARRQTSLSVEESGRKYHKRLDEDGREEDHDDASSPSALTSEGSQGPAKKGPMADKQRQITKRAMKIYTAGSSSLRIAESVRAHLRRDGPDAEEMMETLLRIACRDKKSCTVGWNHLIAYRLRKKKPAAALKAYNEMKKRGQSPDAYTYSVLLQGLADNAEHSLTMARAFSVYNAMNAPNSRVKRNIFHMNAMLKVCSRYGDMDSLWGVASEIPEKGPDAANNQTFVLILNAMRHNLESEIPDGFTQKDKDLAKLKVVMQGKRIWADIVGRWRSGDLMIDESVVSAMGRLLLCSPKPVHWDNVLSLVEQTMRVPRQVDSPELEGRRADSDDEQQDALQLEDPREYAPLTKDGLAPGRDGQSYLYPTPSQNTLSLILQACRKLRQQRAGRKYWNILTDPKRYGIVPDLDNMHYFLRILLDNHASTAIVDLLQSEFASSIKLTRPTFQIAMSACRRDFANPHAFENANIIMNMMQESQDVDIYPKTLRSYSDLAQTRRDPKEIFSCINQLEKTVGYIRSVIAYGITRGGKELDMTTYEEGISLLRSLLTMVDRVLSATDLPKEYDANRLRRLRNKLYRYIHEARAARAEQPAKPTKPQGKKELGRERP